MAGTAQALYDFHAENPTELGLFAGDIINVQACENPDWWQGEINGRVGLFPANYVKMVGGPRGGNSFFGGNGGGNNNGYQQINNNNGGFGQSMGGGGGLAALKASMRGGGGGQQNFGGNQQQQFGGQQQQFGGQQQQQQAPKPAAAGGGGKPDEKKAPRGPPQSTTRFGSYASHMAMWAGLVNIACGAALLCWGHLPYEKGKTIGNQTNRKVAPTLPPNFTLGEYVAGNNDREKMNLDQKEYTQFDDYLGGYAILLGIVMFFYERSHLSRDGSTTPVRSYAYFLLSLPGYIEAATRPASIFMLLCIYMNFKSAKLAEIINAPPPPRKVEKKGGGNLIDCLCGKNPDGRATRVGFVIGYAGINLMIGYIWVRRAQRYILEDAAAPAYNKPHYNSHNMLSQWVPVAKFFGGLMCLNFSVLLFPISRTIIRYLYNVSTYSQSGTAKCFRILFAFFPFDHALAVHITMAYMGAISAAGHVFAHIVDYGIVSDTVFEKFGWGVWITGASLAAIILTLFPATHRPVKGGQFEIFWTTHHLFILFFPLCIFHGGAGFNKNVYPGHETQTGFGFHFRGWLGPNYWKFFIIPGSMYLFERLYRERKSSQRIALLSVTHMKGTAAEVCNLELSKQGPFADPYREGQYAFICCPYLSKHEWHPFTISSAPGEKSVTFHIRVQGKGSWTYRLAEYMKLLGGTGRVHAEFTRQDKTKAAKKLAGKIFGPDGTQLIKVYGPHSAPTQHLTEYSEVMICASGIGVTPLAAAMKSVAHHRWKFSLGQTYPEHAGFYWVAAHTEVDSFRWFIRTIKECEDELFDMQQKNPAALADKLFEIHIYLTSYKAATETPILEVKDDMSFWGRKRPDDKNVEKTRAPFTEEMIYNALMQPAEGTVTFGHVNIHNGRPKWSKFFDLVMNRTRNKEIGVTFCGNAMIGADLMDECNHYA